MAIKYSDITSWIEYGKKKGWVSEIFCDTHEGPPLTDEEALDWDNGEDPCSFHIKVLDA